MNLQKVIIILLVVALIWMGFAYKFKSNENDELLQEANSLRTKNLELAKNERLKIVFREKEKRIYIMKRVTEEAEAKVFIVNLNRAGEATYIEYVDGEIDMHSQKWIFPFLWHISGHVSADTRLAIGNQFLRYGKWGLSLDVTTKDISFGIERDTLDIFPMFSNTYFGAFFSITDGSNRMGAKLGVFL